MDVITLPSHFNVSSKEDIHLFDYYNSQTSYKSKISLSMHVFSFLRQGTKELIGLSHSTKIEADKFLIIKSGNCLMSEITPGDHSYRSMLMFFNDQMLIDYLKKYPNLNSTTQTDQTFFVQAYDFFIQSFVNSLIQLTQLEASIRNRLMKIKFEEIITYLIQKRGCGFLFDLIQSMDDRERHFMKVVESNKLKHLSVSELAFLANMSVSTFKREFKKTYDSSPIKWFQDQKLEHSAFLLTSRHKKPNEIYDEVGYETLSNFTQAFKRKFGVTPRQFQQDSLNVSP
ncbi:MAG: AraC family transcriptional regulator [Bacteroidota bacterium]